MADILAPFAIPRQQQFSASRRCFSGFAGTAIRRDSFRRTDRADLRQARRLVRPAGGVYHGGHGLVVSESSAARRQGSLVPGGGGARGQPLPADGPRRRRPPTPAITAARAPSCPEAALHELSGEVADELEARRRPAWLWKGKHHAKLIDGFTFTMPDTPANQAAVSATENAKARRGAAHRAGRGDPVAGHGAACWTAACGPYPGKETGESALLRPLLGSLMPGDIAVVDRYYCSFMMIALLLAQGTARVCRDCTSSVRSDFRRGKAAGQDDHLIVWTRPQRPDWMDEATYARFPKRSSSARFATRSSSRDAAPRRSTSSRTLLDAGAIHHGRHRRTLWLSLEFGIGHPLDQVDR